MIGGRMVKLPTLLESNGRGLEVGRKRASMDRRKKSKVRKKGL
jgi:hypothetical protein